MENKNKTNLIPNHITNHKHWGLGILAGLSLLVLAGSIMAYSFTNSASAHDITSAGFRGTISPSMVIVEIGQGQEFTAEVTYNGDSVLGPQLIQYTAWYVDGVCVSGSNPLVVECPGVPVKPLSLTTSVKTAGSHTITFRGWYMGLHVIETHATLLANDPPEPGDPITVVAPVGGEHFLIGDTERILWTLDPSFGPEDNVQFHVRYRAKGSTSSGSDIQGPLWLNNSESQLGYYDWKVGYFRSGQEIPSPGGLSWGTWEYTIRAEVIGKMPWDISGWFTISDPNVAINISYNATRTIGETLIINWELTDFDPIPDAFILGVSETGANISEIVSLVSTKTISTNGFATGTFEWKVGYKKYQDEGYWYPMPIWKDGISENTDYIIRAIAYNSRGLSYMDESNTFNIVPGLNLKSIGISNPRVIYNDYATKQRGEIIGWNLDLLPVSSGTIYFGVGIAGGEFYRTIGSATKDNANPPSLSLDPNDPYDEVWNFTVSAGTNLDNLLGEYESFFISNKEIDGDIPLDASVIYSWGARDDDRYYRDNIIIQEAPLITIDVPNGTETWELGSIQTISWTLDDTVELTGESIGLSLRYLPSAAVGDDTAVPAFAGNLYSGRIDTTTRQGTFEWKVGYTYIPTTNTWDLINKFGTYYSANLLDDISLYDFTIYGSLEGATVGSNLIDYSGWFDITPIDMHASIHWNMNPESTTRISDLKIGDTLTGNFSVAPYNVDIGSTTFDVEYDSTVIEVADIANVASAVTLGTCYVGVANITNVELFAIGTIKAIDITVDFPNGLIEKNTDCSLISIDWNVVGAGNSDIIVKDGAQHAYVSGRYGEGNVLTYIDPIWTVDVKIEDPTALPLSGTYLSQLFPVSEGIESVGLFAANFSQFIGTTVDFTIKFLDINEEAIILDGYNDSIPNSFGAYPILPGSNGVFDSAANLGNVRFIQLGVDMSTDDWNITKPWVETLSLRYTAVGETGPFTITVTPMDLTVAPGDTASFNITVVVNEGYDIDPSSITPDANFTAYNNEINASHYTFVLDENGNPWELQIEIPSDITESLNVSGLTFTVMAYAENQSSFSAPVGLFITDGNSITINFTVPIQKPFGSTPVAETDSILYLYTNDANQEYHFATSVGQFINWDSELDIYSGMTRVSIDQSNSSSPIDQLEPNTTYTAFIKLPQYLTKRANEDITTPAVLTGDEVYTITFDELKAGDLAGNDPDGIYGFLGGRDDNVTSFDWQIYVDNFGLDGDDLLNDLADFNNDGSVNALDIWPFAKSMENWMLTGELYDALNPPPVTP